MLQNYPALRQNKKDINVMTNFIAANKKEKLYNDLTWSPQQEGITIKTKFQKQGINYFPANKKDIKANDLT